MGTVNEHTFMDMYAQDKTHLLTCRHDLDTRTDVYAQFKHMYGCVYPN